jgi:hypothetical protein
VRVPQSRVLRIALGLALVAFGLVGFLPILGFWMVPLGLLVLSTDVPIIRRWTRRFAVWWKRRVEPWWERRFGPWWKRHVQPWWNRLEAKGESLKEWWNRPNKKK